jgi:hypothetical protein
MTSVEFLAKQALNYLNDEQENDLIKVFKQALEMEKQQIERMYTEEEVRHIVSEALQSALVTVDLEQWFKQFKKK